MELYHQTRELITRILKGCDLFRYSRIFGAELFKIGLNGFNQRAVFMADHIDQPIEFAVARGSVTARNNFGHTDKAFGMGYFHRFKCYTNKSVWEVNWGRGKPHRASQSYRCPWAVKNRAPLAHRSRFGHGANGSRIRFDRPEGRARWICYVSVLS